MLFAGGTSDLTCGSLQSQHVDDCAAVGEVHGVDWGIAFVGLLPDEERLARAAIGIMCSHKLLPTPWRVCAVEDADLVIVAPNNPSSLPLLKSAIQRTGPITAALTSSAEAIPPGCERLPRPVRASDLRNLLLDVQGRAVRRRGSAETRTRGAPVAGALTVLAPQPSGSLLELAQVLREANEPDSRGCAWIVQGIASSPLYVAPAMSAFIFEGSLSALRNLPRTGSIAITRIPEQDLPRGIAYRPLSMLQWLVGSLLGQKGLLPWIDPEAAYSLRHWPEFAVLKHRPDQQRIAVLLMNRAEAIADIVRLAQADKHAVIEFLNAASLTGRLVVTDASRTAASASSPNERPALLQRLRKALGIVAGRWRDPVS
jgi:hypothetical protein